jgi:hypothetical protein
MIFKYLKLLAGPSIISPEQSYAAVSWGNDFIEDQILLT